MSQSVYKTPDLEIISRGGLQYGLLDVRNVESYLELLYSYTHNAIQLHLSFEIGPFEDQGADFVEIPHPIESVDEF